MSGAQSYGIRWCTKSMELAVLMHEGDVNLGYRMVCMQEGQRFSGSVDTTYNNLATSPRVVSTSRRQAVCPASMSSTQWGQYGKADMTTKTLVSTTRSSKACWLPTSVVSPRLRSLLSAPEYSGSPLTDLRRLLHRLSRIS